MNSNPSSSVSASSSSPSPINAGPLFFLLLLRLRCSLQILLYLYHRRTLINEKSLESHQYLALLKLALVLLPVPAFFLELVPVSAPVSLPALEHVLVLDALPVLALVVLVPASAFFLPEQRLPLLLNCSCSFGASDSCPLHFLRSSAELATFKEDFFSSEPFPFASNGL